MSGPQIVPSSCLPDALRVWLGQVMGTVSFQAFMAAALEGRSGEFLHQHLTGGAA